MDDEHELSRSEYPPGAAALYKRLRVRRNGANTSELVGMVERRSWRRWVPWCRPPADLTTITQVLDCADALTKGGFLCRTWDGLSERWTVPGRWRRVPKELKRGDAL